MGRSRGDQNLTSAERQRIGVLYTAGMPIDEIVLAVGRTGQSVVRVVIACGGVQPRTRARSALRLSLAGREEISLGMGAGESYRAIGRRIGRAPSTVLREVRALRRGRRGYRSWRG